MTLLDTHVLIWLVGAPERLSAPAKGAIAAAQELTISTATVQEIAYLVHRDRLAVDRPLGAWFRDVLAVHGVGAIPPTVSIALRAGSLDATAFHGDPADRLIYATAVEHDAELVTADSRLREADPTRTVW